jgi:hypothetical protein
LAFQRFQTRIDLLHLDKRIVVPGLLTRRHSPIVHNSGLAGGGHISDNRGFQVTVP